MNNWKKEKIGVIFGSFIEVYATHLPAASFVNFGWFKCWLFGEGLVALLRVFNQRNRLLRVFNQRNRA